MLSRLLSRRSAAFSRQFYNPTALEYPVNIADEGALRNKAMMDEVNNNFSHILKKVKSCIPRSPCKATKLCLTNCTKQVN
jgi:hypothetical protein